MPSSLSPSCARPSTFTSQATLSEPFGVPIALTQSSGRSNTFGGQWCFSLLPSGRRSSFTLTCHNDTPSSLRTRVVGPPSRSPSFSGLLSFLYGLWLPVDSLESRLRFSRPPSLSSLPGFLQSFERGRKSGLPVSVTDQGLARSGRLTVVYYWKVELH